MLRCVLASYSNACAHESQLATPGHTRILLLGRFRVREDADFLTLAKDRFGFHVKMSDVDSSERSSAASYKLIDLCWPEGDGVRKDTFTKATSDSDTRPASVSLCHSNTALGTDSLLLDAEAFTQLQRALGRHSHIREPELD